MICSTHRPTVAQVCLEHIRFNAEQVKCRLPEDTEVWAVVKADAYGHGAVEVSRYLADDVTGFCLSNLDEALELRQAGLSNPLLVMGVVPVTAIPLTLAQGIDVTVTSLDWLEQLVQSGQPLAGLRVHLKVDTGMGRLGFRELAELNQALALMTEQGLVFAGLFTHFARADEADTTFFDRQLAQFKGIQEGLAYQPERCHISNSAAAIWHPETALSAVRLGNSLYGLNPSGHQLELPFEVKPALSLFSELVQVKQVESGTSLGYGGTYLAEKQEWIGTVPIGYADGLTRDMQGFDVLVEGQRCEIVGRVSMDQIMIRLPKAYPLGTKVTLIGQEGEEVITVQDWADYRHTINYEVLCLLSDRIPRLYNGETEKEASCTC